MRTKYVIGFFAVFLVFGLLLSAGYQMTYEQAMEKQSALDDKSADAQSIETDVEKVENTGEEEDGYYLCELQGFVVVYLSDRTTVYEFTEIPLTDLPDEVQQEISAGKYISGAEELYGFLENYSS